MKKTLKSALLVATAILCTGFSCILFTGCEEKTVGDKVKDGLDARPNEGIKDAGEEIKDEVKDAVND